MNAAIAKLSPLGFPEKHIRETVNEILQTFAGDAAMGWRLVEDDNYRMVINMLQYRVMKKSTPPGRGAAL